jgi:nitrite reductase/ring-hydroxylating ferredoxin subunit
MRHRIGRIDEIPSEQMRQYSVDGSEILVANQGSQFYALAARCTHAGAPLVEGSLQGEVLTCPWHGSRFKITDGSLVRGPAEEPLKSYPVSVEDGYVVILI